MKTRKYNLSEIEIIRTTFEMFLDKGYSKTTQKAICNSLGISSGHLTYYYPTKEHILAVLVKLLCDFQTKMIEEEIKEGYTSLLAFSLELTVMASICEEDEIFKEFYLSSYTHPLTLEIIRNNDALKAMSIFGNFCNDWSEQNYQEAETIVSGVEYATIMTTKSSAPLEFRIKGALHTIMSTYNVPQNVEQEIINKILLMNYQEIGRRTKNEFIKYINTTTKEVLEETIKRRMR